MGGKSGGGEAARARADEEARQARIRSGTTSINNTFDSQFTDDYYKQRRNAYIDYATPQLEDQYADAQKQLTYALARGGLLDSSIRGSKLGELQQQYALQNQDIADKALASETDARNAVEDARSNLITTLNATGDAEQAASTAISRASALSQPAAYSPLASLFSNFTDALGTQAALSKANSYAGSGTGATNYSTGLFNNRNSVRNSR